MNEQTQYSDNDDIEEVLQTRTEADKKALLAEISGDDFNPDTVVPKSDPKKEAALAMGEATMTAVLGISEQILKQFGHKSFSFDPEQMQGVASAAAPLFVKYNGELPPWLANYREELTFVVAAGALGFNSFTLIQELKAIDKAKDISPDKNATEEEELHAAN